jgi:hypothetical protein
MAVTTTDIQYNNSKLHDALNNSGYICSHNFTDKIVTSINTKPVSGAFLYGMAGTGKSYLPMILAKVLERQLFVHQCTQGTREEDLLVKIMPSEDTTSGVKIGHGKLFQAAIESNNRPVILMLDEWDKTRPSVDGFFLDFLQYGRLSLPGIKDGNIQANLNNLTIFITANDEREFHEALLRRFPMIHVNPIEPADVVSALNLTHKDNSYIPQMIDLYTRSLQARLPKPATIQELRQLLDAIELLGSRADWDALVYQYVTKTPENHILLSEQKKVRELNVPSMKKITADDYGVDVVPERNESNEPEMPDLRDLANFDSSFEKTQYVPKNATAVLKRNTGTQSKSYIRLADDFIMHRDMDKNGPELAAMPEWGAITENYSFITTEFTSMHIAYLDRVNYFKGLVGEVKIVDKYATRKEVNRLLHSKWTVHKRDKTEVIARLEGRNHIDLRYREGKGLEIVASTDESMSALFKMNVKENLSSIADIANARSRSLEEVDMINSTYLAVPSLDSRIKAGICSIGNSVLKSFENHQGFCQGIWLRSPSGEPGCETFDIPFMEDINENTGKYKVHSIQDGFIISARNLDMVIHRVNSHKHGLMKVHIHGVVDKEIMSYILHWFPSLPLYKCFKHDGEIREKLRQAGWVISRHNTNSLENNKIYAHIVYDYVIFCAFLDGVHLSSDPDALSLDMKRKINRIKALEKAYKPIKD